MKKHLSIGKLLPYIPLAFLWVFLLLEWYLSLQWRMVHDTPILHYVAFLVDKYHLLPYKDIFETSMPGVLFFEYGLVNIFGYSDIGFRLADLLFFLVFAFSAYLLLKPIDKWGALFAIGLFGIQYLAEGHSMSLERDYIGVLPVIMAIFFSVKKRNFWLSGIFWGLTFWIKPHLIIGGIPVFIFIVIEKKNKILPYIWKNIVGFFVVFFSVVLWLWWKGILSDWMNIFFHYLPLHLKLNNTLEVLQPELHLPYLWKGLCTFNQMQLWLLPFCFFLLFAIFTKSAKKPLLFLLIGLTFVYWLYPAFTGQFWRYHWMPFKFFLIVTAAFIFAENVFFKGENKWIPYLKTILVIVFLFFYANPYAAFKDELRGEKIVSPYNQIADELALYLETHTIPTDLIQPLDWTEGSIQALLQAKRRIATPFLYDYFFYNQYADPRVQSLRKKFIDSLNKNKPELIIDMKKRIRVSGVGTTDKFPELESFILLNYSKEKETPEYIIYRRKAL